MGLFDRLFRRRAPPSTPKVTVAEIENVVHTYSEAMLSKKSVIADVSELPYTKATIKAALLAAISATTDAKMRDQLKSSYVMLADFQEGVGSKPYSFDPKLQDGEDEIAMMKRIAASPKSFPEISTKVLAEGQSLLAELKALGL
jgi:hypothetical protein